MVTFRATIRMPPERRPPHPMYRLKKSRDEQQHGTTNGRRRLSPCANQPPVMEPLRHERCPTFPCSSVRLSSSPSSTAFSPLVSRRPRPGTTTRAFCKMRRAFAWCVGLWSWRHQTATKGMLPFALGALVGLLGRAALGQDVFFFCGGGGGGFAAPRNWPGILGLRPDAEGTAVDPPLGRQQRLARRAVGLEPGDATAARAC